MLIILPKLEYNSAYAPKTENVYEYHKAVEYVADTPNKANCKA